MADLPRWAQWAFGAVGVGGAGIGGLLGRPQLKQAGLEAWETPLLVLSLACVALGCLFAYRAVSTSPVARRYRRWRRQRLRAARIGFREVHEATEEADPATRMRLANFYLHRAYRQLCEPPPNTDEATHWTEFDTRLRLYQAALNGLHPRARAFHESILWRLERARRSDNPRIALQEPLNELADILFGGELDLDVVVSDLNAIVFRPDTGTLRDRFVIISASITNREDTRVSLIPSYRIDVTSSHYVTFSPDVEPLPEWEGQKRKAPFAITAPLPVPLSRESKTAARGHWCFYIDYGFELNAITGSGESIYERAEPLRDRLEIVDLVSGRRTQTDPQFLKVQKLKPRPIEEQTAQ